MSLASPHAAPAAAPTAPLPPGAEAPPLATLADPAALRPRDAVGLLATGAVAATTAAGVALSLRPAVAPWLAGQALLALALVQWLVLLHEAGHGTLFATRALNGPAAWLAGLFAGIPAPAWRLVHARHHRWTGWQDRDPTTRSLVPRPLGRLERWTLDVTWALGLPLVAVLYRRPYWALPALLRAGRRRGALVAGALVHVAALAALVAAVPLDVLLRVLGLSTLLALMVQDPLLLSQHTHVPLGVAGAAPVLPVPARAQPWYTRSLRLPALASALLLGFDAHEKHHAWPQVPGWRLRAIPWTPPNELAWWRWLVEAKRLRGHVLLFRNRAATGAPL